MTKLEQLEQAYFEANRESWKAKEALQNAELAYHRANEKRDKAYAALELEREKEASFR